MMRKIILEVKKFVADEDGVTAIEYALLAALISLAILSAVTVLGDKIASVFTKIAEAFV